MPTDKSLPIVDVSEKQDNSIVVWPTIDLNDATYRTDLHWYSDRDKVYLHPDCKNLFDKEFLGGATELDLSEFSFDKVIDASNMFGLSNATTLNITGWKGKSLQQTFCMFNADSINSIIGSIDDINMNHMIGLESIDIYSASNRTMMTYSNYSKIPYNNYNTIIPLTGGSWSKDGTYELSQAPAQTLKPISSGEYDCGKFFRRSTIAPASDITAVDMSWRQDKSILFWKVTENGIEGTKWYSTYPKVYLNPDCTSLGTYLFPNVEYLDLSDFLFDKVLSAGNMFDKCQMTGLDITGWKFVICIDWAQHFVSMLANIVNPSTLVVRGSIENADIMKQFSRLLSNIWHDTKDNPTYMALKGIPNPNSVIPMTGGSWNENGTYVIPRPPH